MILSVKAQKGGGKTTEKEKKKIDSDELGEITD